MFAIPNNLIRDQKYSNLDVCVWIYANFISYNTLFDNYLTSGTIITDYMYGTIEGKSRMANSVSESLNYLIDSNVLKGKRVGKMYYKIYKDSFIVSESEYFTLVDFEDIRRIMEDNARPFAVIRHYLLFLSTISQKTKCCIWSNDEIANILDEDPPTLSHYFKVLEKMGLLYIYRGIYASNTYGRPEDREAIIKCGQSRSKAHITLASNQKRRMTQMYNQIKNGKRYDNYLMEEIYNYCSAHNEREHELQEQNPKYVPNLFDLSVIDLTSQS